MEWKNIYRGILMGASDVIPGVSGGTIAVLLGIYDQFIAAINGLFSKDWKKHILFLVPLGIGMGIAVLALSRMIKWLFEHHPVPTQFFFLGLIIGIIPFLFREAKQISIFKTHHIIILVIGIGLCMSLVFLDTSETAIVQNIGMREYTLLFFAGMLASAAMILPGISGSFVLLVIGYYHTVIDAVSNLKLNILLITGFGVIFGILFMSKLINYFMQQFKMATYSLIIGLVIGSIIVVFPGFPSYGFEITISILTFAIGLFAAYILGRVEYKEE